VLIYMAMWILKWVVTIKRRKMKRRKMRRCKMRIRIRMRITAKDLRRVASER
jgi:hypothetical protein